MSPSFNATGVAGRRAPSFQHYLNTLPPQQARELVEQERRYLVTCVASGPSDVRNAAERDFEESMRGFTERPAGKDGGY